MIIVDTGVLLAAANRKDENNQMCKEFLATEPRPLFVPSLVLGETCYMIGEIFNSRTEAVFLERFNHGRYQVVEITMSDRVRMAELLRTYEDFAIGAVDASVVAIAERFGVADIATVDYRHFRAIKPNHAPHFNLLPADLPLPLIKNPGSLTPTLGRDRPT